jgi:hypothetical protein
MDKSEIATEGRRRVHVPSSVVVTLMGALLTVWLAPAVTRQWEDRQAARDLKARIAEEAVISALQAIEAGAGLAEGRGAHETVDAAWRQAALKTEIKAKAYLENSTVKGWEDANQAVKYFLLVSDDVANARVEASYPRADDTTDAEYVYERIWRNLDTWVPPLDDPNDTAQLLASDRAKDRATGMQVLRSSMLATVGAAADVLLSAHASGFSTTRGDLLKDLLP